MTDRPPYRDQAEHASVPHPLLTAGRRRRRSRLLPLLFVLAVTLGGWAAIVYTLYRIAAWLL